MADPGKSKSVKQSIGYSAVGSLGTNIISLLGFIVLARILSPDEYGLMAIVAILTAFATIFIELGMDAALIHNQQATERHYSTAFWVNLAMGVLFCGISVLAAESVAAFFDASELVSIIRISSIVFILNSMSIVPFALLKKRKHFRNVAKVELVSVILGFILAVVMALKGFGVWALVANLLCTATVRTIFCFVASHWMPQWTYGWKEFSELWSYSSYLFGTYIFNYAIRNVDNIMVGKLLGAHALGAYKYAYQIASFPATVVNGIFHRVFFSSYAEFQDDKTRIKVMHLKITRMVAFFTFPAMLGLGSIADHFVLTVLGEKWSRMAIVLPFLTVILLIDTVGVLNTSLFLSQGKTKQLFWLTALIRSTIIFGVVIGIQFGLEGLLWGLLLAKIVSFYPVFHVSGRMVDIRVSEFLRNLAGVIGSSLFMVAVLFMLQDMYALQAGSFMILATLIVAGTLSYAIISLIFQRQLCRELTVSLRISRQLDKNK
jgi:PST family polysaccharide transporter